uniref:Putative ovule protein n=1 Tax=Solanum chacoense TaxID=4108 RepID=A0A0V0H3N1_SOLCH
MFIISLDFICFSLCAFFSLKPALYLRLKPPTDLRASLRLSLLITLAPPTMKKLVQFIATTIFC